MGEDAGETCGGEGRHHGTASLLWRSRHGGSLCEHFQLQVEPSGPRLLMSEGRYPFFTFVVRAANFCSRADFGILDALEIHYKVADFALSREISQPLSCCLSIPSHWPALKPTIRQRTAPNSMSLTLPPPRAPSPQINQCVSTT